MALAWAVYYGLTVTVGSGLRSLSEQAALRSRWEACVRRGERVWPGNPNSACRYPANRPGDSAHNFGLAFDSSVPDSQQWVWDYLRRYAGFHVPAGDLPHAEVPDWRQHIGG